MSDIHPVQGAYDPSFRERLRRRRERCIAWLLTDQTVGGESVPNQWASLTIRPKASRWQDATRYHVRFADDASGVMAWMANDDTPPEHESVCVNVRADVFRRMALWYLWRWAVGEWFGVRRWLFYQRLFRRVTKRQQKAGTR